MKRPLARVAMAVLFAALLVVGSVLPAAADGPIVREPGFDPTSTLAVQCPFPVEVTLVQFNKTSTVWQRPDGTFAWHYTGVWKTTWTNLNTGYSVSLNFSGPFLWTFDPTDGSEVHHFPGTQVMGDSPDTPFAKWLARGNLKVYIGPEGWTATWNGNLMEFCDLLNH